MGSTICTFFMAMIVLWISIPHSSSEPDGPTQALINEICRQTNDFNDCRNSFHDDLYNDAMEATGLTEIALVQTLLHASETRGFLHMAQSNEKNQTIKNLYPICIVRYGQLINVLEDANWSFAEEDYRSMIPSIERSQRFVDDCQFILGNKVPELGIKNSHAKVLIQMAFVSGKLIGRDI